jgi:3-hydroxybutyryl-CoA dehydratase
VTFSTMHLYFDDLHVGQEFESLGRTITEADIVNFAGLSGDFNPIHVDHVFAQSTPFRRPIAHGLLVLACASGLSVLSPPMRTLAFIGIREWMFRAPLFVGDTIRVRSRVNDLRLRGRGRRGEVDWQRTIVNQDGKVVQEGVLTTLVECRPSAHEQPSDSCRRLTPGPVATPTGTSTRPG